nr:cysteine peptidase family C39 domain-containing protein [Photobacterium sp. SKA34]
MVRQQLDMSCGMAVISNILTYEYGQNVPEEELIEKIGIKPRYSFIDIQNLALNYEKKHACLDEVREFKLNKKPCCFIFRKAWEKHFVSLSRLDNNYI